MLTIIIYIPDVENVGSYRRIRMGCREILALLLLVISVIFTVISFVTPYWAVDDNGISKCHTGLWYQCKSTGCGWYMEKKEEQSNLPGTLYTIKISPYSTMILSYPTFIQLTRYLEVQGTL